MAAGEQTDQDAIDDVLLSDDNFADLFADLVELSCRELKRGVGGHLIILDVWKRTLSRLTFTKVLFS